MTAKKAIEFINRRGALLVYPINNAREPSSLWSEFFPKSDMRWEWDEGGDNRVSDLWHLRAELSASGNVVYAKWYSGRATFFSRKLFPALARVLAGPGDGAGLSREARLILEALRSDSPLSTKQLRRATDLQGKFNAPVYERALKELWQRLLIVGFGEIDDGAFPSLAIGATELIFEDLHEEARSMDLDAAMRTVSETLAGQPKFLRFFERTLRKTRETATGASGSGSRARLSHDWS